MDGHVDKEGIRRQFLFPALPLTKLLWCSVHSCNKGITMHLLFLLGIFT